MNDGREAIRQQLCMLLTKHNIPNAEVEVDFILGDYEIQKRTTEIALLSEDRNRQLFNKFLSAKLVKGLTERTIDYYKKSLVFIFDKMQKNADEVTTDDIRLYLAVRQKRDMITKTTANNELRVLSSFYQFLTAEEIMTRNPTLKIDKIKTQKKKKKAFTELEVEKLREAASNSRDRAVIEVLLSTWCRVSELVKIKRTDIENDRLIVRGKGEKDRTVYLNARATLAIERHLEERKDDNPYIFCGGFNSMGSKEILNKYATKKGEWYKVPELVSLDAHIDKGTIEQMVRKLKKRSGITSECHPHKFRRTGATMALRRGMPIEQVSKMLGHESIETTQIYLDLNEKELEMAHKKYVV